MRLETIPAEKLSQIEKASGGTIKFEITNSNVTKVTFPGPDTDLVIQVGSYSVTVCRPATKEVFYFSYMETVRGEKILLEKEFDSEYERTEYIRRNFSDVEESEYNLEIRTVPQE